MGDLIFFPSRDEDNHDEWIEIIESEDFILTEEQGHELFAKEVSDFLLHQGFMDECPFYRLLEQSAEVRYQLVMYLSTLYGIVDEMDDVAWEDFQLLLSTYQGVYARPFQNEFLVRQILLQECQLVIYFVQNQDFSHWNRIEDMIVALRLLSWYEHDLSLSPAESFLRQIYRRAMGEMVSRTIVNPNHY